MKEQDLAVKWFNTVFYPQNKTGRAVRYDDGVLARLRKQEVLLFTPWGPRYDYWKRGITIEEGHKEIEALKFFAWLFSELKKNMPGKKFSWLFLGADLYGTRINGLPDEIVKQYFESFKERLEEILPQANFKLWSSFDQKAEIYRERVRGNFYEYVPRSLFVRASETAKGMRRGSDPREYLIERIAEAMLIEEKFRPIKLSGVARYKDDKVDMELPRLYFVPETLHAPWM